MTNCCDAVCNEGGSDAKQRGSLWAVLWINVFMFALLLLAGYWGKTVSLFADCFDNLGDAVTYGFSLWAVGKSSRKKAKVALFKGSVILFAALAVTVNIAYKIVRPEIPVFEVMGTFSLLALFANGACLYILWKHRSDDLNMESVWHCSRNDIMTNLSVLIGAGFVWYFNAAWPDILIACGLVILLFHSAFKILSKSFAAIRAK